MRHSLISQYRQIHACRKHYKGRSTKNYATQIGELVIKHQSATILDYGSGRGRQYEDLKIHRFWGGLKPRLYDPAVPGLDKRPAGQFDGVICTDVLEHVPEEELAETLDDIRQYAKQWVFLGIFCAPAKKRLPDGRNAHVTIRPPDWWRSVVNAAFGVDGGPEVHMHFRPQ